MLAALWQKEFQFFIQTSPPIYHQVLSHTSGSFPIRLQPINGPCWTAQNPCMSNNGATQTQTRTLVVADWSLPTFSAGGPGLHSGDVINTSRQVCTQWQVDCRQAWLQRTLFLDPDLTAGNPPECRVVTEDLIKACKHGRTFDKVGMVRMLSIGWGGRI